MKNGPCGQPPTGGPHSLASSQKVNFALDVDKTPFMG